MIPKTGVRRETTPGLQARGVPTSPGRSASAGQGDSFLEGTCRSFPRIEKTERTPERFERIRQALLSRGCSCAPERALLITGFFRKLDNPNEPW